MMSISPFPTTAAASAQIQLTLCAESANVARFLIDLERQVGVGTRHLDLIGNRKNVRADVECMIRSLM